MAYGTFFEVHAGDFKKGKEHQCYKGQLIMKRTDKFIREDIKLSEIDTIEPASEESVKRVAGTVGWGAAGAVLLGPVGLLAGLLMGGRGKDVTFVCCLKDGRKFMATAPAKLYTEMTAAIFK